MKALLLYYVVSIAICLCLHMVPSNAQNTSSSSCYLPGAYAVPIWQSLPPGHQNQCNPGFFCPNLDPNDNKTWATVCQPSSACSALRSSGQYCAAQGLFEPIVCPAGFYCPTFTEMFICPSGSFCITGSTQPTSCEPISYCPEGTSNPRYYGVFLWLFFMDGGIAILYYLWRKRVAAGQSKRFGQTSHPHLIPTAEIELAPQKDIPELAKPVDQTIISEKHNATQRLIDGFRKACGSNKGLHIDFERLSLKLSAKQGGKTILTEATGSFIPGRTTAIMGPSGASKTTLLSTVLGKIDNSWTKSGTLTINGEDRSLSSMKHIVGYVPQEDVMCLELSVYDNIKYAAKSRLPTDWTEAEIEDFVDAIISALHLDHVRYSRVGDQFSRGISGGQRKRVNIGMELAAAPSAIFLDEPTTGLDATSSLEVVHLLNKLAMETGITVVMVIHQPRYEIYESLDNLLLLAPGGRTVYEGPQIAAVPYFVEVLHATINHDRNPADSLMDAITIGGRKYAEYWKTAGASQNRAIETEKLNGSNKQANGEEFRSPKLGLSPSGAKSTTAESDPPGDQPSVVPHYSPRTQFPPVVISNRSAKFWYQIFLSHQRAVKQQIANIQLLVWELLVTSIIAAVFALGANGKYRGNLIQPYTPISPASQEDVPQIGLYISLGLSLTSTAAAVSVWASQVPVYWREAASGHSRLAFFIGMSTAQFYRIFLASFHFACFYFLVIAPIFTFGSFFGILFPLVFAWYQWSAFTIWFFDRRTASLIAVIGGIIWSVLCGIIQSVPAGVKYVSAAYWATEALYGKATSPYLGTMNVKGRSAPLFGYVIDRYNEDIGLELAVGFAWSLLAFLAMILHYRSKQK